MGWSKILTHNYINKITTKENDCGLIKKIKIEYGWFLPR